MFYSAAAHHQLRNILPFVLLRASTFLPPAVFNLARNPCRRFCTRLLGLKVHRLPPKLEDVEKDLGVVTGDIDVEADEVMDVGIDGRLLVTEREESVRERLVIDVVTVEGRNEVG